MSDKKPLKVTFSPDAFSNFDGSAEELRALQEEITSMFLNMTPEELEEASRPMDLLELAKLIDEEPDVANALFEQFMDNPPALQ